MATLRESPNYWGVKSDADRVIYADSRHFSDLSILFLLPISTAVILYPSVITALFGSNSATAYFQQKSFLIVTLCYALFVLLFSIFATASITYSTFHGFFNRSVSLISSVKSIASSFFPLLLTVLASKIILISIFVSLGLLGGLAYEGLVILGIDVDYGSNGFLGFVITIAVLIVVVTVYLQVEWSLAYAVVVNESKFGFAALKRSSYLLKGTKWMKWSALVVMFFHGILPAFLAVGWSVLIVSLGGINGGWVAIFELVLWSVFVMKMMVTYVPFCTVLYLYCLALRGEMGLQIAEESIADYVSLTVDHGKD